MNAEEAIESPREEEPQRRFGNIAIDDSTEVLFEHKKTKKKKSRKVEPKNEGDNSTDKHVVTQPTLMAMSTIGQLPDLRSPQTILSSIEQKEKLLAAYLTYDKKSTRKTLHENDEKNVTRKLFEENSIVQKNGIPEVNETRQSVKEQVLNNIIETTNIKTTNTSTFENIIEKKKEKSPLKEKNDTDVISLKDKTETKIDKEKLEHTLENKEKDSNTKKSVIKEQKSDSINNFDLGGLIDIDNILTLQQTRNLGCNENLKPTFSNGKVMKKSRTSVMNEKEEMDFTTDKSGNSSISTYTASPKTKRKDGASRAIPIMSKSTEMPGKCEPNFFQEAVFMKIEVNLFIFSHCIYFERLVSFPDVSCCHLYAIVGTKVIYTAFIILNGKH